MRPVNGTVTRYWLRYYCDGVCTLCGNSGQIDTTGVKAPTGRAVGRRQFCICPNGQTQRRDEQEHQHLETLKQFGRPKFGGDFSGSE